jgi:maleate cis-trans isomerase
MPGGAFQTMKHVAAWEERFGKPVVSTNQAALWAMLGVMKVKDTLPGLGRLLAELPAG